MSLRSAARRALYPAEKTLQRARFMSLKEPRGGWPALLGISFPKSGTHLLDQILLGFARFAPFSVRLHSFYAEYEGESGRKRSAAQARAWLDSLRPLDVASAHLFATPTSVDSVISSRFVPYFIYRDPRDVVVSHVFYVTDMEPTHVHHAHYKSLPDFDARLKTSILGRPEAGVEFPDIAARFQPYLRWLDEPTVLPIHFEDLVQDRPAALARILDHFLARVPLGLDRGRMLGALEAAIDPARSPTFRSGKTGEWRKHFTAEHTRLFKDVSGDLLVRLGYETNSDW